MDLAIVGLPQSGKTTVFSAITAGHGSGGARQEQIGIVKIPDERLDKLAALVSAKKVTPIEVQLHDLPPVFQRGAGPGGESSETLAKADALIHVVRAFQRDDVSHPLTNIDPHRDIEAFGGDLILNDLGIVERRLDRLEVVVRSSRPSEREAGERERVLLQRMQKHMEAEKPLRDQVSDPEELKAIANYGLLSVKPMLILLNLDERDAARAQSMEEEYQGRHVAARTSVAAMCAKLESELVELSPEESAEFRREIGGGDVPTRRVLRKTQDLLSLVTFFTAGDESRAWTVRAGSNAQQAAGRIHTDIERGFIRAEVIAWDKLLEMGSESNAKKHGLLRTEGKQYIVQDGDVINVLFNV